MYEIYINDFLLMSVGVFCLHVYAPVTKIQVAY